MNKSQNTCVPERNKQVTLAVSEETYLLIKKAAQERQMKEEDFILFSLSAGVNIPKHIALRKNTKQRADEV